MRARVVCVPLSHLKHATHCNFNQFSTKMCILEAWNYWFSAITFKLTRRGHLKTSSHSLAGWKFKPSQKQQQQRQKQQQKTTKTSFRPKTTWKCARSKWSSNARRHTHAHIYSFTHTHIHFTEKKYLFRERQQAHRHRLGVLMLKFFRLVFVIFRANVISYWNRAEQCEHWFSLPGTFL